MVVRDTNLDKLNLTWLYKFAKAKAEGRLCLETVSVCPTLSMKQGQYYVVNQSPYVLVPWTEDRKKNWPGPGYFTIKESGINVEIFDVKHSSTFRGVHELGLQYVWEFYEPWKWGFHVCQHILWGELGVSQSRTERFALACSSLEYDVISQLRVLYSSTVEGADESGWYQPVHAIALTSSWMMVKLADDTTWKYHNWLRMTWQSRFTTFCWSKHVLTTFLTTTGTWCKDACCNISLRLLKYAWPSLHWQSRETWSVQNGIYLVLPSPAAVISSQLYYEMYNISI